MKRTVLIFTAAMLILTSCNTAEEKTSDDISVSSETSTLTSSETSETEASPETTLTEQTETSASTASATEAPIETVSSDKNEEKVCTCPNE